MSCGCRAFQRVGFFRCQADEEFSSDRKPHTQAEWRTAPRHARSASQVSHRPHRRKSRYHHAGTRGRTQESDRHEGRSCLTLALAHPQRLSLQKKRCWRASKIAPMSKRRARNGPPYASRECGLSRIGSAFSTRPGRPPKRPAPPAACPKGQRLRSKAPFGHWMTQTFVAGLRCDKLTAPFVINAPMDRRIFETYVEKELAPTLAEGDIVIMDNLPAHKSKAAEEAIKATGAWVLFLPPYSPDLNPIEMAFAKLKAHLRATAVRTIDALWQEIGRICDLFDPHECQNYFAAAGYGLS